MGFAHRLMSQAMFGSPHEYPMVASPDLALAGIRRAPAASNPPYPPFGEHGPPFQAVVHRRSLRLAPFEAHRPPRIGCNRLAGRTVRLSGRTTRPERRTFHAERPGRWIRGGWRRPKAEGGRYRSWRGCLRK